jgi:hypothetical protein
MVEPTFDIGIFDNVLETSFVRWKIWNCSCGSHYMKSYMTNVTNSIKDENHFIFKI